MALALALTACGGDDEGGSDSSTAGGEEMTAAGAEAAVVEILTSTDPASCQRMTDAYIEEIYFSSGAAGIKECEDKVAQNPLTEVTASGVSVEGETASGTISTGLGSAAFTAVYEDGTWKLDSFVPSGQ